MKPQITFFLLAGVLIACQPKDTDKSPENDPKPVESETETASSAKGIFHWSIPTPEGFKALDDAEGDLTKDSIPERVIVYENGQEGEMGLKREIHIYRKGEKNWILLEKIKGGVLPSEHGGMMGDPFAGVDIERGCIVLEHFGGSRWKWNYTHRFRFQNNRWELIGATILSFANCEESKTIDYNLSTGNIVILMEKISCEEDEDTVEESTKTEVQYKLDVLPELAGYYPGNNELNPTAQDTFYY